MKSQKEKDERDTQFQGAVLECLLAIAVAAHGMEVSERVIEVTEMRVHTWKNHWLPEQMMVD